MIIWAITFLFAIAANVYMFAASDGNPMFAVMTLIFIACFVDAINVIIGGPVDDD